MTLFVESKPFGPKEFTLGSTSKILKKMWGFATIWLDGPIQDHSKRDEALLKKLLKNVITQILVVLV